MTRDERSKKEKQGAESGKSEERGAEGMFLQPFPGDQDKVIEPNWKPAIYWVPPFLVCGLGWIAGFRNPFHLIIITVISSALLTAILHYLFFAESDYFTGIFRDLFGRR